MQRNLSTRRFPQGLLCCLARELTVAASRTTLLPLASPHLPAASGRPDASYTRRVYVRMYSRAYIRATDLFGHYSRYVALSSSLPTVPQLFSNNRYVLF